MRYIFLSLCISIDIGVCTVGSRSRWILCVFFSFYFPQVFGPELDEVCSSFLSLILCVVSVLNYITGRQDTYKHARRKNSTEKNRRRRRRQAKNIPLRVYNCQTTTSSLNLFFFVLLLIDFYHLVTIIN